ncbi:MAG: hypothetical protein AB1798_08605, partial [Spirochaetota bacterium]
MNGIAKKAITVGIFFLFSALLLYSPAHLRAQSQTTAGDTSQAENQAPGQKAGGVDFGLILGLGAQTFYDNDERITYQSLSLNPDLAIGKFGIGIDVTLHFTFTGGDTKDKFKIRSKDWIPDEETSFLELYLPKFRYIRYGFKGEPLYIKLGVIEDGTLGNGFIMGNYSNALFLPEKRIFGLSFDLDGKLFKFPYLGIETFVGNLAAFDVIGARLFGRPLIGLKVPIIKNLEIGGTIAADRDPFFHTVEKDENASVVMGGADFKLPILTGKMISLSTFADIA